VGVVLCEVAMLSIDRRLSEFERDLAAIGDAGNDSVLLVA